MNGNVTIMQQPFTNITNLQRQVEQVPNIQNIFNDSATKKGMEQQSTEIERECHHVNVNYGVEIDEYQRELEKEFNTANSLNRHKVTAALRSRMIDWMIEVLTNFKCDDQTFFLAVSLLDRYFKAKQETREVSD